MHKILILIISFYSLFSQIHAQNGIITNNGTKSLSLGGISSTLNESDALFNNFSNITSSNSFSALASSERRFELEELTSVNFGVQLPVSKFGNFGLVLSTYGFDAYKERKISLLFARALSKYLSVSVNFDLNTISIDEFGNKNLFSFGIGASGKFSEGFRYGIYIFNPEKIEIAESTEVPGYIKAGIVKDFTTQISLYSELVKVINEDLNFIMGIDYQLVSQFAIRFGYHTSPGAFAFGLTYSGISSVIIEGGTQYNTILGVTPGISVKFQR